MGKLVSITGCWTTSKVWAICLPIAQYSIIYIIYKSQRKLANSLQYNTSYLVNLRCTQIINLPMMICTVFMFIINVHSLFRFFVFPEFSSLVANVAE